MEGGDRLFSQLQQIRIAEKHSAYDMQNQAEGAPSENQVVEAPSEEASPRVGMHISAIRKFLSDHPDVKSQNYTTSQINRAIVKPETLGTDQPYVSRYVGQHDTNGVALVAPATTFVSHAWKYQFVSTVVDVMEQHALNKPDAYFWFDLFTNDQNAVAYKDFDWFSTTFRNSIREIGQVVLVLSPWNDPLPVRRAWCLFEISSAITDEEVDLVIYLPQKEARLMAPAVVSDNDVLIDTLANIQAEKAEATSADDKELIFSTIRNSQGGFQSVNKQVKKGLREWYMGKLSYLLSIASDSHDFKPVFKLAVARVASQFGHVDEALTLAKECLNVDMTKMTEQYYGAVCDTLASAYSHKGDLVTALEYKLETLTDRIKKYGENDINVAISHLNVGSSFYGQGKVDKALEHFTKSLIIRRAVLGESHKDVAISLMNLANAHRVKGQFSESLECHGKSLEILLQVDGENHTSVAMSYNNIANVYKELYQLDKCLEYHHKALKIRLSNLGAEHQDVTRTFRHIGNVHKAKGDLDKALEYYNKALSSVRKDSGEEASIYMGMGPMYMSRDKKDPAKALEYYNKALDILLRLHDENHPDIATLYNNIGNVHKTNGELDKALELHNKSLKIKLASFGENHPDVAMSYTNMANLFKRNGDKDKAFEYHNKALQINIAALGEHHPALAPCYNGLADLSASNGRLQDALDYLGKAALVLSTTHNEHHPTVRTIYGNMAQVCKALGQVDKANEYHSKAKPAVS